MNTEEILLLVQIGISIAVLVGGYYIKGCNRRLEDLEHTIVKLEVENATRSEQARSIFQRLDSIERKLDEVLKK